jgi:type VI secretion system protein VasD
MTRPLSFFQSRWALCALVAAGLTGCASPRDDSSWVDKTLESLGITKPISAETAGELAAKLPKSRRVKLRLYAAPLMNLDSSGRPLAVVARIYALTSPNAMLQATYESLRDAATNASRGPEDTIGVREIVLAPGEHQDVVEALPEGATHLAVVALMRSPDPQRWKFVFDAREAASTGLVIGLHACAMSVAQGTPVGVPSETASLAGMVCPKA